MLYLKSINPDVFVSMRYAFSYLCLFNVTIHLGTLFSIHRHSSHPLPLLALQQGAKPRIEWGCAHTCIRHTRCTLPTGTLNITDELII